MNQSFMNSFIYIIHIFGENTVTDRDGSQTDCTLGWQFTLLGSLLLFQTMAYMVMDHKTTMSDIG